MSDRRELGLGLSPKSILPEAEDMPGSFKWLAYACAAIVFLLIYNAYPFFGMLLAPLILGLIVLRLSLYVWLSPERGQPDSERHAFVARLEQLTQNRHLAKLKQLGAKR